MSFWAVYAPDPVCPGVDQPVEGSSLSTTSLLWPPGAIDCIYTAPDGAVTRGTEHPWTAWSSIALFALGIAAVALGLVGNRRRRQLAFAGIVLLIAAPGVWIGYMAGVAFAVARN